jgi:hypothetical protein
MVANTVSSEEVCASQHHHVRPGKRPSADTDTHRRQNDEERDGADGERFEEVDKRRAAHAERIANVPRRLRNAEPPQKPRHGAVLLERMNSGRGSRGAKAKDSLVDVTREAEAKKLQQMRSMEAM